ncbi:MAG: nicotinate phosphoribosyltransferase [Balneolaceae bacterium]
MYIKRPASFTDYYELTMAQGYFEAGKHHQSAIFDYFFRTNPFKGGYVIFSGLKDLLGVLENFTFNDEELSYLKSEGFSENFITYLKGFSFRGSVYSVPEGEVVFPNEPILRVEGTLIETQIIETLLLNILNFQSLIATKASRIKQAAGDCKVLDFGLRRSQGLGGIHASRAAMIGGFDGTSNVYAAQEFGIKASGTMAHSWVQAFDDELSAFRAYSNSFPDDTILLVDTYNTLKSGIPNAIKVAQELKEKGHNLVGIRLDSGDLAYFSQKARKMLDDAGFPNVKIAASNQLDERVITSLKLQKAEIDIFGVGTRLVTGDQTPALDGVYKLASVNGEPKIKISENVEKITTPGAKQVFRYTNGEGNFYGDAVVIDGEPSPEKMIHPIFTNKKSLLTDKKMDAIQKKVMENGNITIPLPSVSQSASYCQQELSKLTQEYKRFENPHIYKVGLSSKLLKLRNELIKNHQK